MSYHNGMASTDQLLAEVLALPEVDRERIAGKIIDSLTDEVCQEDPDVESAWREEIVKRVESIANGTAEYADEEDVERETAEALRAYELRQNSAQVSGE